MGGKGCFCQGVLGNRGEGLLLPRSVEGGGEGVLLPNSLGDGGAGCFCQGASRVGERECFCQGALGERGYYCHPWNVPEVQQRRGF